MEANKLVLLCNHSSFAGMSKGCDRELSLGKIGYTVGTERSEWSLTENKHLRCISVRVPELDDHARKIWDRTPAYASEMQVHLNGFELLCPIDSLKIIGDYDNRHKETSNPGTTWPLGTPRNQTETTPKTTPKIIEPEHWFKLIEID